LIPHAWKGPVLKEELGARVAGAVACVVGPVFCPVWAANAPIGALKAVVRSAATPSCEKRETGIFFYPYF